MGRDGFAMDERGGGLPRSWHAPPASLLRRHYWRPRARPGWPWVGSLVVGGVEETTGRPARRLVWRRALQGAVLALGAPFGWLAIQTLTGSSPVEETSQNPGLYVYLLLA